MNRKCAIHHCFAEISYGRISPVLATDWYCKGHGEAVKGFMVNSENFTWVHYKDYTEEQEKIKHMEKCLEDGQAYERSRQIEMRDILYSDIAQKGWIEIDVVPPPKNEMVILRDDLGSYAGFRVGKSEYRKLTTVGVSMKNPEPNKWMPLPKRK